MPSEKYEKNFNLSSALDTVSPFFKTINWDLRFPLCDSLTSQIHLYESSTMRSEKEKKVGGKSRIVIGIYRFLSLFSLSSYSYLVFFSVLVSFYPQSSDSKHSETIIFQTAPAEPTESRLQTLAIHNKSRSDVSLFSLPFLPFTNSHPLHHVP